MTDTSVAITEQPRPPANGARDRSERQRVTGKLRDALDLVVNEGLDPYEAAQKLGMHARSMRLALNKRHVLTYLRGAREVFRLQASAQNIHHAVELRANAKNEMARLGAMKFIEGVEDTQQSAAARQQAPGFIVQVVVQAPVSTQDRQTQSKPLIEHASGAHEPTDDSA